MATTKKKTPKRPTPLKDQSPSNKGFVKPAKTSTKLAIAGNKAKMKSLPKTTVAKHKAKAKKSNMPKTPLRKKK